MYISVRHVLSMDVLLFLAAGMAITKGSSSTPSSTECSHPDPQQGHSLVSSLLQVTGYSDTCVAAALDSCSSAQENGQFAALMEEARGMVQQISHAVEKWESRPRHCKDLLDSGDSGSGLRQVYPYSERPHHRVTVYCDHTVDGGGWTVFQRRSNDTVRQDFYRTWIEYQLGFGDLNGEFWLGLDLLHDLTSTTLQELRVDLDDYEGAHRWAKYGFFHVDAPETKYLLSVGRYSGNAGDSMKERQHGSRFSTHDADNDKNPSSNCAVAFRGAWWYAKCHRSNLNGYQYVGTHSSEADGINWYHWRGYHYSMRRTSMMIRPAF